MCTLSWWIRPDKRGVLFNRDEQHSRQPGGPLVLFTQKTEAEFQVYAPVDSDAGGTWIGLNTKGLIVALLNYYGHETTAPSPRRSRGKLVVDLLSSQKSVSGCFDELNQQDMSLYSGCLIFCFDRQDAPRALLWSGHSLSSLALDSGVPCLTTSSVRTSACVDYRKNLFEGINARDDLMRAHMHYNSSDPALGPLMYREDAATDSFTEITLGRESGTISFQTFQRTPPVAGNLTEREISLVN
ncbi:MAG: NRDE family protein [Opitutales bacterium]